VRKNEIQNIRFAELVNSYMKLKYSGTLRRMDWQMI